MNRTQYISEPQSPEDSVNNLKSIYENIFTSFDRATDMRDLIPCGRAHLKSEDLDQKFGDTTLRDLLRRMEKMAGFLVEVTKQIQKDLKA